MSFAPRIRTFAITNGTTAGASVSVNLPATVSAGDTLFVIHRVAVAGAIGWPANWTELVDASPDGADDQISVAWKKADGSEGGTTITLTQTSGKFASAAWAIQDAEDPTVQAPELSTVATGTSAAQPDATTVTPTGGAKAYLFLTFQLMEGEETGVTTYPTNYTDGQSGLANSGTAAATTTNCICTGAARRLTTPAASEDAGAWTIAGTLGNWSAYTAAFHPLTLKENLKVSESITAQLTSYVTLTASPTEAIKVTDTITV